MKTFIQWAEVKKLDLPRVSENTKRSGIAYWQLPSAARRGLYPDLANVSASADSLQKMGYGSSKNGKKPNDVAPPDTAAK